MLTIFDSIIPFLLTSAVGYYIGSIPTGWLVAYRAGVVDITKYGSGNIGATNVGRALGVKGFSLVLFLDSFKAYAFMYYLQTCHGIHSYLPALGAISLLIGNGISLFLQGKGGKGIATSIGILLALQPYIVLYLFFIWLLAVLVTKKMGIACIITLLFLPFINWYLFPYDFNLLLLSFFIPIWGIWRHEKNIRHYFAMGKMSL